MRNIISGFLLLLAVTASAQENVSLNGEWRFWIPETKAVAELPNDAKKVRTVTVPHTYNIMDGLGLCGRGLLQPPAASEAGHERQERAALLQRSLSRRDCVGKRQESRRASERWLHAVQHGNREYLDFSAGAENTLEVRTGNSYSADNLPWKRKLDWAGDGGIYRDVWLHVSGRHTLRYVHVTLTINLQDSTATAHFDVRLWQADIKKTTLALTVTENKTAARF